MTNFMVSGERASAVTAISLLALVGALFAGLLVAVAPSARVFAALFLPILVIFAWISPSSALIALFATIYGVIPDSIVPNVPAFGGSFKANDLALGALFVLSIFLGQETRSSFRTIIRPVMFPALLLWVLVVVSLMISFLHFQTHPKHILAEMRNFIYWAILPIVVLVVGCDRYRFDVIVRMVLGLGYVIAFALILQHFTGFSLLSAGRVEQLVTLDRSTDVVRTTSPGIYVVILSLYVIVGRWLCKRISIFSAVVLSLPLFFGILVTFGRGVWIAAIAGLFLLSYSIEKRSVLRIAVFGFFALVLTGAALTIVKPDTAAAVSERFLSVGDELNAGSSAEWRYLENQYAIDHLVRNPIFGVGVGGFAHPKFHPMMTDDLLRYVHNGYLYLAVKLGVLVLLVPIVVMLVVKRLMQMDVARSAGSLGSDRKAILAGFLVPCITSITQPEWMVYTGVSFLALTLGLALCAAQIEVAAE